MAYIPNTPCKLDVVLTSQLKKQVLQRRNNGFKDTHVARGAGAGWSRGWMEPGLDGAGVSRIPSLVISMVCR